MFGFGKNKKKQEPQKKQSGLDKIILGAVVGGAIGSVLGVGLAPKKGSETRKDLSKGANKLFKNIGGAAKKATSDLQNKLPKKAAKELEKAVKKIPHEL